MCWTESHLNICKILDFSTIWRVHLDLCLKKNFAISHLSVKNVKPECHNPGSCRQVCSYGWQYCRRCIPTMTPQPYSNSPRTATASADGAKGATCASAVQGTSSEGDTSVRRSLIWSNRRQQSRPRRIKEKDRRRLECIEWLSSSNAFARLSDPLLASPNKWNLNANLIESFIHGLFFKGYKPIMYLASLFLAVDLSIQ